MRNLGAFFGHLAKAVKTDPRKKRIVVKKTVEQEDRGDITLRRTTIDEIEFKPDLMSPPKADEEGPGE